MAGTGDMAGTVLEWPRHGPRWAAVGLALADPALLSPWVTLPRPWGDMGRTGSEPPCRSHHPGVAARAQPAMGRTRGGSCQPFLCRDAPHHHLQQS